MDHENVKTVNLTTNQKSQCEEITLIQPMKIKYSQVPTCIYWWVPKFCNMKPIIQFIILLRFSFIDFIHFVRNDI